MFKHTISIIVLLIIITVSEQAQSEDINFNIGMKAGLNFTKTDYIGEGKYFYIDHLQKSTPAVGWDLLCYIEPIYKRPLLLGVGLGIKKSNPFIVGYTGTEEVMDLTLAVYYVSTPLYIKMKLYRYLPDVTIGLSPNFPLKSYYIMDGRINERYKKRENKGSLNIWTTPFVGVGKEFKILKTSISFELIYLFYTNRIKHEEMGVIKNKEIQFLISIPISQIGGTKL